MRLGWLFAALTFAFATPAAAATCKDPEGLGAITASKARFIIFGELHGTEQSPTFVGDVACALVTKHLHILVALELGSPANPALQAAWAGPQEGFAETLIRTMPDWVERNDGVTSRAMLAMLVRLHDLKAQGHAIAVVAFNGARDAAQHDKFKDLPGQGGHEAAQAENIRNAAEAGRYDRVLVLVGNAHARKVPIDRHGPVYEPMAMRLAPPAKILTLDMAHAPGSAWNCQIKGDYKGGPISPDAVDCSAHQITGGAITGEARLLLNKDLPASAPGDPAYDGVFFVGPVSASPPVGTKP